MKLQYASDLHLEFSQNKEFLRTNQLKPAGDILLLAGDIVPFAVMRKFSDFFSYLSDHFQATYWVPGNHEYYNSEIVEKHRILNEKIRDNVFLVNNSYVNHGDIKLIFTTLWSKISPPNEWYIRKGMSDFQVIKYKGEQFSPTEFNQLHEESMSFLKQELSDTEANKTIIVTHHVPTFLNYPEKYKSNILNEAFAVELFDFIECNGPDYWIYGHTHTNTLDFAIGKTHMITNQLGYVKYNEHHSFIANKTINI